MALHEAIERGRREFPRRTTLLCVTCLHPRIAAYMVPEKIHIVPSLPIGLTGKVHRQTLREWAAAAQFSGAQAF